MKTHTNALIIQQSSGIKEQLLKIHLSTAIFQTPNMFCMTVCMTETFGGFNYKFNYSTIR